MDCPQGPRTFTWREQVLLAAALMADSAHRPVIEGAAREEGASAGHWAGNHCPVDSPLALCPSEPPQWPLLRKDTCFKTPDLHLYLAVGVSAMVLEHLLFQYKETGSGLGPKVSENKQHVIFAFGTGVIQANYQLKNENRPSPLRTEIVLK